MHVSNSLEGFTLVFPLHKQIIASWSNLCELKDRGKAFQAIVFLLFSFRGLRCACPRLPTSASRCVLPSRQGFTFHSSLFTLHLDWLSLRPPNFVSSLFVLPSSLTKGSPLIRGKPFILIIYPASRRPLAFVLRSDKTLGGWCPHLCGISF